MIVYFRVCEKQSTISRVPRFNNIDKTTLIKKCWLSIQNSIDEEDTIFIISDKVSESLLQWMIDTCATINVKVYNVPKNENHAVFFINLLLEQCKKYPNEIHYAVEDDYLHVPDSLHILESSVSDWDGFFVSYDYPDRYRESLLPCFIMIRHGYHWRTTHSATLTLGAKGQVWLKHRENFEKLAPTSDDGETKNIFKETPCISPITSLSTHMTQYHMSPAVDWEKIYNSIEV